VAVNSAVCWPRKAFVKHPGVVTVSIGPAIASEGRQADHLMAEVSQWIEAEMRQLDPLAYPPSTEVA
jgi:1-acyl-sn-glycerol-3-phosphate acyltransferase